MPDKITQGIRIENPRDGINPGEYGKSLEDGTWWICTPNDLYGRINDKIWKIIEHEDNTITVSPSILVSTFDCSWHGWLEKGIWREG
jgi:hypothetical protein